MNKIEAFKLMQKINNKWQKIVITNTYELAQFHIDWAKKQGVLDKFKIVKLSKKQSIKIWKDSPFRMDCLFN